MPFVIDMSTRRLRYFTLLLALLVTLTLPLCTQAQEAVVHYVYDAAGRLVGVVDQEGNAASYTYDAVGNIVAISHHNVADTPGPVAIMLVSPNQGKVGTEVSIFGRGFSPDPAQNSVAFNGAIASVSAATANSLTTSVPLGALTGPITVTTPLGTATSPEPFTVLGAVSISPANAVLFTRQSQQFTATMSGTIAPSVAWSVNGVVGGNATVGTISAAGLYTAPVAVPSPPTLTVTVTRTDDPSLFSSATVLIVAAPDKIFARPVSVAPVALTASAVNNLMARSVSVQVANPLSSVATFLEAPLVAVTPQPVIASVTPSTGLPGTAGLSVLLTGAGFVNATGVTFELNGVADPNLSITSLVVSPDGTQATFALSVAPGAVPGLRVVRITTPAGTSTAAETGGNLFSVE